MKKKSLFIITMMCLAGLLTSLTGIHCYADGEDTIPIIINDENYGGSPIIRAPGTIPIEAAYYPSLSCVLVSIAFDLGSISVEIENLTTGAYSQATVNATQGVHPFLISGDVGAYEIMFTLSDGRVYFGSFEIE